MKIIELQIILDLIKNWKYEDWKKVSQIIDKQFNQLDTDKVLKKILIEIK